MSPLVITAIVFGCIFGGSLLGMAARRKLPQEHLSGETKETVRLAAGIVGTMTAMLLGLLVASSKSSFDTQVDGVAQIAGNVILLDRLLSHYGPEAQEVRATLRASVIDMIQRTWPDERTDVTQAGGSSGTEGRYERVFEQLLALKPKDDAQRQIQTDALKIVVDTGQLRWLLLSERASSSPLPFLVLMVFWLAISFASFGLFAPSNSTAMIALLACTLAVATALFLILELNHPFQGIIRISSAPFHGALEQLGR